MTNTSADLPTGITLPITSLEDLQAVETILQDKTAIKQMVSYLVYNRACVSACVHVLAHRLSSAFSVVILGAWWSV